jgi:hypothetical protein
MSILLMSKVWLRTDLDIYEKFVLLSLADQCNEEQQCYPAIKGIGERCSMSDRGVRNVLQRLTERGFVAVLLNAGKKRANLYSIVLPLQTDHTPAPGAPCIGCIPAPGAPLNTPDPAPGAPLNTPDPAPGAPEPLEEEETEEDSPCVPQAEKTQRRRPEVPLPPDWVLSDRNLADARAKQFSEKDIEHEADQFRNYHAAKGSKFRDWDAAWRTWLGNARKFNRPSRADTTLDAIAIAARNPRTPNPDWF